MYIPHYKWYSGLTLGKFLQKYWYRKDQTTETFASWSSDTFLFTFVTARNEGVCELWVLLISISSITLFTRLSITRLPGIYLTLKQLKHEDSRGKQCGSLAEAAQPHRQGRGGRAGENPKTPRQQQRRGGSESARARGGEAAFPARGERGGHTAAARGARSRCASRLRAGAAAAGGQARGGGPGRRGAVARLSGRRRCPRVPCAPRPPPPGRY